MKRIGFLVLVAIAAAEPSFAQPTPYVPAQQWPGVTETDEGFELTPATELIAVLISHSGCAGNAVEGFDAAVRGMKDALAARADSLGFSFAAIGVATDWEVRTGIRYLLEGESTSGQLSFGPWAEVVAGRNYIDSASSLFVLPNDLQLAVPQVFLFTRSIVVSDGHPHLTVGKPEFHLLLSGGEEIVDWARSGWRVPSLEAVSGHGFE